MLINDVPVSCINLAAVQYHVPALVIVAVLYTESGYVGAAKPNKNKTIDYGPMQINSFWLPYLKKYGYTIWDLQYDPCLNVNAGTWILAQEIAKDGGFWHGIGNYHSHSHWQNLNYQYKVDLVINKLANIISKEK